MSSRFTTRGLARSLCYAPGFLRLRGSSGSFRRPHKSVSGEEADVNNRRVFTGAVANELNDNILPRVNQCKYLGHVITDDLKDDSDIARQYKRIYAQGNALIRKFYMCSEHVKCTLFRSFCTSLYTCQLWCNYKSESIRKLYVAYNNVFRLLHVMNRTKIL